MSSTAEEKDKDKVKTGFETSPRSEWTLISQGAEARVWKLALTTTTTTTTDVAAAAGADDDNKKNCVDIVCKERFSKTYRHPDLDARLTKSRCRSEAKILEKCLKKSEIRVPKVIRVEMSPPSLFLEFLRGPSVKSHLQQDQQGQKDQEQEQDQTDNDGDNATTDTTSNTGATTCKKIEIKTIRSNRNNNNNNNISEKDLAHHMGQLLGRLHNIGIVHGDLTTSNMMILEQVDDNSSGVSFELALIDFGLSKSTFSVEEQAVDLYVLERALLSTHPNLLDNFFDLVLETYKSTRLSAESDDKDKDNNTDGKKRKSSSQTTLQRLEQVRMRGRKRECFG